MMSAVYLSKRQWGQPQSNIPSLWVFLIIVLGVLLALVLGTSFVLHMMQRRQRNQLQRRIARGEVDLELLGIKRMNVPQSEIDKMPEYIFNVPTEAELKVPTKAANTDNQRSTMFSQATCAICLDDFVNNETKVRELPCNHIFHPECIDPFIRDNSSLCPLCKKSALPAGFCPVEVTNIMVRRERLGRRVRAGRSAAMQQYLQARMTPPPFPTSSRPQQPSAIAESTAPQPDHAPTTEIGTELGPISSPTDNATNIETPPAEIASQGTAARRAWRRERLARQHDQEFDQSGVEARHAEERRPWWRRMMGLA